LEKSSEAFRTIGEMAEKLGVKTHILRYWEEQFPMLQPLKRAGGRRHYRPSDVAMLTTIHSLLHNEGYTIKGARKFLSNGHAALKPVLANTPAPTHPASLPPLDIQALKHIRDRLDAALAAA
jgi:DNA-binding transcriptional MerR regulator